MSAGEAWHSQVASLKKEHGSIKLAVANGANLWWSYINSHLNASPELVPYMKDN